MSNKEIEEVKTTRKPRSKVKKDDDNTTKPVKRSQSNTTKTTNTTKTQKTATASKKVKTESTVKKTTKPNAKAKVVVEKLVVTSEAVVLDKVNEVDANEPLKIESTVKKITKPNAKAKVVVEKPVVTSEAIVLDKVIEVDAYEPLNIEPNKFKTNICFNIVENMKNAFDKCSYKLGVNLIILKNITFSAIIAYFLYVELNTDSFSFRRMTFTDATSFALKVFIALLTSEIVYLIVIYLLNRFYKHEIEIKRLIAALGNGQLPIIILSIICGVLIFHFNFLGIILLSLILVLYILVLFNTIILSGNDDLNQKFYISFFALSSLFITIVLFWPLVSGNLVRIIEIMF